MTASTYVRTYVRTHLEAEASADSPPCGLVWRGWEGLEGLELSDSIYVRTHLEARGFGGCGLVCGTPFHGNGAPLTPFKNQVGDSPKTRWVGRFFY